MGVTGLWTVVAPTARPVKLESLNKKRLAVDASIWIYQFLKAVRDKEGNALRNAHVVGFFRRICKLLYFGIKPVFVFDGGAPELKRKTIAGRKLRREGRREDAVRAAGRMLAVRIRQRVDEEIKAKKRMKQKAVLEEEEEEEEEIPEDLVYVEELNMTAEQRAQNRRFKKQDQYHLPDLDVSLEEMGGPSDPRIMSHEELQEYARQFTSGEDVNLYDFSKIDFDGPFFSSLPASDRYNILNAARLRSRLRMGYSKDQLDTMFPDRMAFSRFQIERVRERNELTQRLMNINGMNDANATFNKGTRVAGEKDREYVLVKNDAAEGGWALGVVRKLGQRDAPIDVEKLGKDHDDIDESGYEDEEFEDVPIEGLNRLPHVMPATAPVKHSSADTLRKHEELYGTRTYKVDSTEAEDDFGLFLSAEDGHKLLEDQTSVLDMEDEDLQRAIAMSLEQEENESTSSNDVDKKSKPTLHQNPFVEADDADNYINFKAALKEARESKYKPKQLPSDAARRKSIPKESPPTNASTDQFDGLLPFEKLDLGLSLLSSEKTLKKQTRVAEAASSVKVEEKTETTLYPPWFAGGIQDHRKNLAQISKQDAKESEAKVVESEFGIDANLKSTIDNVVDASRNENIVKKEDGIFEQTSPSVRNLTRDGITSHDNRAASPEPTPNSQNDAIAVVDASDRTIQKPAEPAEPDSPSSLFDDVENFSISTVQRPNEVIKVTDNSVPLQGAHTTSTATTDAIFTDEEEESEEEETNKVLESVAVEYDSPSDEELFTQLAEEAEEHARFASSLHANEPLAKPSVEPSNPLALTDADMKRLRAQQRASRRDADEVTYNMIADVQVLLRHFGLPYITAPMEAEAQCSELLSLGLVDGIITDDSDVFLFGGTRIFKNVFNTSKFIECYLATDLTRDFHLSRDKLIDLALLLGSDYADGIQTVGPVTALEIVAEFTDLDAFASYWTSLQHTLRLPCPGEPHYDFFSKHKRLLTTLAPPVGFPSPGVRTAYLEPEVDNSPEQFQWGLPDLDGLRLFLSNTVGWSEQRTDEILVPVVRDLNRRLLEGTQSNITRWIDGGAGVGSLGARVHERGVAGPSRRMQKALGLLKAAGADNTSSTPAVERRRKRKLAVTDADSSEAAQDAPTQLKKPRSNQRTKRKGKGKTYQE